MPPSTEQCHQVNLSEAARLPGLSSLRAHLALPYTQINCLCCHAQLIAAACLETGHGEPPDSIRPFQKHS